MRRLVVLAAVLVGLVGCGKSASSGGDYFHDTATARAAFFSIIDDNPTLSQGGHQEMFGIAKSVCSLMQSNSGDYAKVKATVAADAPTVPARARQTLVNASIVQFCPHFSSKVPVG